MHGKGGKIGEGGEGGEGEGEEEGGVALPSGGKGEAGEVLRMKCSKPLKQVALQREKTLY